jgi:hypothetical protein
MAPGGGKVNEDEPRGRAQFEREMTKLYREEGK